MQNLLDSLKNLVSQEMTSKASAVLGENSSNVSTAITSVFSGFMGVLLKEGKVPQIRNIFEEAGNLNILSDLNNVCEENLTEDQQRIGDSFLQQLLGDKAADFTNPIADHSGVSKVATNRLVSMVAPIFAGFFGNKLVKENWSMSTLLKEIDNQKNSFARNIPEGVIKAFGLSSVLNGSATHVAEKKAKGYGWLPWVILVALLLLIFFWWRSCNDNSTEKYREDITVITTDTISQRNNNVNQNNTVGIASTEFTLPDGSKIRANKGGIEDEMIKFLQSDEYKNAKEKDLNNKWFEFDDLAFEFGSSTKLMDTSHRQLNNIVAILKNYKDAKVKIAGFADKVGTDEANLKISKERAKTIEGMLEKGGIGSQIVKTEGFGDEYAKHSTKESNEARADDRDIALRFVK